MALEVMVFNKRNKRKPPKKSPGKDRWRSPLPCTVLVYLGPLRFASIWEWLAIYFHYGFKGRLQKQNLNAENDYTPGKLSCPL